MFFQQAGTLLVRHDALDIFAEHADTLDVLAALGNDDVGIALCGLYKLLVHGLEHFQIAVYHHRDRTSAIDSIALNVSDQPLVGIGIHKTFKSIKSRNFLLSSVIIPSMIMTGLGST